MFRVYFKYPNGHKFFVEEFVTIGEANAYIQLEIVYEETTEDQYIIEGPEDRAWTIQ